MYMSNSNDQYRPKEVFMLKSWTKKFPRIKKKR